ncbi:MAG: hypothetical protein FJY83_01810 [Candidatus Aminicenantes bacterium]|nr:hypothetical protein [Candidatus Aminicenantes bacterium]
MTDRRAIRDGFPVTRERVCLMSAAMSPLPRPVFDRITAEYRKLLEEGDIHWTEDRGAYRALSGERAILEECV